MSQTSDIPPGDPTEDIQQYLDRAKHSEMNGEYDSAIELYLRALAGAPDDVTIHELLRTVSLKRKVAGGKAIGVLRRRMNRTTTRDDKVNMLNAERMLSFDPGHSGHMVSFLQSAHRAGFEKAVAWMESILRRANGANQN